MSKQCSNCKHEIVGNFCPNCGRSAKLKRINAKYILDETMSNLLFEKGFFYTTKELFFRPGKSIKEYIEENRTKLMKPIVYVIVTSLIYSFINHYFGLEQKYAELSNMEENVSVPVLEWLSNNYGYANLIMSTLIALWMKIFFRKANYNYFEILVLIFYTMGAGMLIFAAFAFVQRFVDFQLLQYSAGTGIIYASWAMGQFFNKNKLSSYLKSFFAYVLGYLFFIIISVPIVIIITIIQNGNV